VLARPSTLTAFGPDAIGAHLEFAATKRVPAFAVDVVTVAGRPPMLDPMPCPPTEEVTAQTADCYGFSDDDVATVEAAHGGKPGRLWLLGYHVNETYNRVESVGVAITSAAIVQSPYGTNSNADVPALADLDGLEAENDLGPETADSDFTPVPHWRG
jgi:hypothetical protein